VNIKIMMVQLTRYFTMGLEQRSVSGNKRQATSKMQNSFAKSCQFVFFER